MADETTLSDIKTRIQRWQKSVAKDGKESERTWIFAVNIDDVNLMLKEIERLEKENSDLRLRLLQAREQTIDPIPSGELRWFFHTELGPYQISDTPAEREWPFAHGPYDSREQAENEWWLFVKRQKANGQP